MPCWVKICGVRDLATALLIEKNGFSAVGFNFYPKSKRFISPEEARFISENLTTIKKVGIFVNEEPEKIIRILNYVGLDYLQLHGNEPPEIIRKFPHSTVIKAIPAMENLPELIESYISKSPFAILIDTPTENYGGSGKTFNHQRLSFLKELDFPVIIAGGLNESNFQQPLKIFKPFGLDFNSGVEISPGIKSSRKIVSLKKKLKEAGCLS